MLYLLLLNNLSLSEPFSQVESAPSVLHSKMKERCFLSVSLVVIGRKKASLWFLFVIQTAFLDRNYFSDKLSKLQIYSFLSKINNDTSKRQTDRNSNIKRKIS